MSEELLRTKHCQDTGYHPQIYFEDWWVAYLNDTPKLHLENMEDMQRHSIFDEVFVPLKGNYTSCIGDGGDEGPGAVRAVELEPGVTYNVRRGAWHIHATGLNAPVLTVENADVSPESSNYILVNIGWPFRREEERRPRGSKRLSLICGRRWSTIPGSIPSLFEPNI